VPDRQSAPQAQKRGCGGGRPGCGCEKKLIEDAYLIAPQLGLAVWTEDEAGPYQTAPYAGESWHAAGQPLRLAHEHLRNGTAKLLLLFEPARGQARVQGVLSTANAVLHPWLKQQLQAILADLSPAPSVPDPAANRRLWQRWQQGLRWPLGLPDELPALRLLLVLDNLAGHLLAALVCWLFSQGIMPLYTPLGGSWLNMAESFQRILKRRALEGQHPQSSAEIITLLEQTAEGWNRQPTPFEWGGRRAERRQRARARRHALGGSGACTRRPVRWRTPRANQWQSP
jgi:DDE superfamily endonuclease